MTITDLNTNITEVENKVPDTSSLVTTTKIPDHAKYITTPKFNKFTAQNVTVRSKQADLVSKNWF